MLSWLKKYFPTRESIRDNRQLNWLSSWWKKRPYLWSFTCNPVANGVAIGLLTAFIPLPGQMLLAALLAFPLRANLPVALGMTWISNPITFVPINYLIYKVGVAITQVNNHMPALQEVPLNWQNLSELWQDLKPWLASLGKTYLVGWIVVSCCAAILGYILVIIIWHGCAWWKRKC